MQTLTKPQLDLSERVADLREQAMRRGVSFVSDINPFIRAVALWRAVQDPKSASPLPWQASGKLSRVQVRAAMLRELVSLSPVELEAGWRLAGNHLPTATMGMVEPDPDDSEHLERLAELGVIPKDAPAVRDAVSTWRRQSWDYAVGEADTDACAGAFGVSPEPAVVFRALGWIENHSIRDYAKVLRMGFDGIRQEVAQRMADADPSDPETPQRQNFWKAALLICDAGILLGQRYAAAARLASELASTEDEATRLRGIAEACAQVPARGARTFREAVQSLWLAHILTCGEDGINANSLGRLDQILYPYYRADVDAGTLTRAEALEWMEELACRLYLEYDVQAITVGGVDRTGRDAVNELSEVVLEATRAVDFVRDLSVRLGPSTPQSFIDLASSLIVRGGGIPFIFNDACFIPALVERGIAAEDARDYAPIGCVELTIPGRASPHAVSGHFCSTKCLELALFDGQDPRSGVQVGPHTGLLTDFAAFDELYLAYCQQTEALARRMVYHCNRGELAQREGGPLPCLSVLTDDCIARGRDITDGGAVYAYHSICFIGTANTADSLLALKKWVFDEQAVKPQTVLDALRADYSGYEPLRQQLLRAPKYGNDIAEVDAMAGRVAEHFIALMDTMRSPLGGRYFVHLFSFRWNLDFGAYVGATPDGRRAGDPLAYSLSAHQGRDVEGITALLNSLARLPHTKAAGGSAAIVEVDPALVAGEAGCALMSQLITTAMEMGVGQLQWNVVTAERLRLAQADPERYGNIAVRVAGYSQMFRLIPKDLQDHIIARTKHQH